MIDMNDGFDLVICMLWSIDVGDEFGSFAGTVHIIDWLIWVIDLLGSDRLDCGLIDLTNFIAVIG